VVSVLIFGVWSVAALNLALLLVRIARA